MSHTPGPWEWVERENYPITYLRGTAQTEDDYVLSIYESHGGGDMPRDDDANLIAAAPDLLSALKKLVEAIGSETASGAVEIAEAAIAKAEGH